MLYHKKQLRNKIFTCIVISIFLISSFSIFNFSETNIENNIDSENDGPNNLLNSAAFDNPYTGTGYDQEGRLYFENNSTSTNNHNGQFTIEGPRINTYLDSGEMIFEFDEDFTTEHIMEDDDALELPLEEQINFGCKKDTTEMTVNTGSMTGDFQDDLFGFGNDTYVSISTSTGIIDFTIDADFSSTFFQSGWYGNLDFNREEILGFITTLSYNLTANADLTISLYDDSNSKWEVVVDQLALLAGASDEINRLEEEIINTNLNFVNSSDFTSINFHFDGSGSYQISLHEFSINATYAFSVELEDQYPIALEFDIRGNNTLINGFYAWIRTVDIALAETTELNISLYKSEIKVLNRDNLNLYDDNANPQTLISDYSITLTNYTEDKLNYFKFNTALRLDLFNYFIRFDTNNSDVYSLITIDTHSSGWGDTDGEHILKKFDGAVWIREQIEPQGNPHSSGFLDASGFKLNVTRGYNPSDFIYNDIQTLQIDGIPIEDTKDLYFEYSVSDGYQWGLGIWNNTFINAIDNGGSLDYTITMTWDNSEITDFYFDVSCNNIRAYSKHDVSATYSVYYNDVSNWIFNFDASFSGYSVDWDFADLWFVYDRNFEGTSLNTQINGTENVLGDTDGEQRLNNTHDKLILPYEIVQEYDGIYELNTTSYNAIDKVYSYLDYGGKLWEIQGFMDGDVMKIGADIRGYEKIAPTNGDINVTLYNPDGSVFITNVIDTSGTLSTNREKYYYEFNNNIFLNVIHPATHSGTYNLGMFWKNGTSIGCKSIPIYIDQYNINFGNLTYDSELDYNILRIEELYKIADPDSRDPQPYDLYIASINETSIFSNDFYAINNSVINQEYSYETYIGDLTVRLNSFMQNESIINPGENIKFNITLENLDDIIDANVKISVELVSSLNDEWIIANETSTTQNIKHLGDQNEGNIKSFIVDFDIPLIIGGSWNGVNAPIRMGGAKTLVKIYVENEIIGIYECPNYALLVDETEDIFEGYILALKSSLSSTAFAFEKVFNREDCTYYPQNTTFLLNIVDKHSLSSYSPFIFERSLHEASKFTNVNVNPELPTKGNIFNISSVLTSEFETTLIDSVEVICQYNNSGVWENITDSPKTTNSLGYVKFSIDTEGMSIEEDFITIRLLWGGSTTYLNETYTMTIDFFTYVDSLAINANFQDSFIIRNKKNYLVINLINTGDSILNITSISLDFSGTGIMPLYNIVQQDTSVLHELRQAQSTIVGIEISFQDIPTNTIIFNISVIAKNIETNLINSTILTMNVNVIDRSIFEDLMNQIMIPILLLIGFIWVISLLYSYRLKKKIESPLEKTEKPKQPKGRYLKVSEISKKTREKEEIQEEKKKTTDLDSLLEEEGLED
ncbi:MAG: hypothetical protein JXA99_03190 [Candidatus Lokiarchaeota archaeon]|nr:hypothetical protein [Candidatus Lokiarchaeota archaeon]